MQRRILCCTRTFSRAAVFWPLKDRKLVHYRGDYTAFKKMHLQKRTTLDKEYKKQQELELGKD